MCVFVLRPLSFPYRRIRTRALSSACHTLCNNHKLRNPKKTLLNNQILFRFKKLIIFYAIVDKHYKTIPLSFEKPDLEFLGIFDGTIAYSYHILPTVVILIVRFTWPREFGNYKITQRRLILQYSFSHFPLHLEMVLAFLVCSSHINDPATFLSKDILARSSLLTRGTMNAIG